MNEQNHELKTFGPQFLIDTGNETMTHSGKTVYFIQGITKDKIKNNISFHETGFARYYTENILQIESGVRCKDNEDAFRQIVHHGNYDVNADKGDIKLTAKNIIIEATNNLSLLAPNTVQIGFEETGATKQVLTNASRVHTTTKGGNIGDLLKTSSLFSSFAGSYASAGGIASAAAGMYASPLAGAAGKFAKKFF